MQRHTVGEVEVAQPPGRLIGDLFDEATLRQRVHQPTRRRGRIGTVQATPEPGQNRTSLASPGRRLQHRRQPVPGQPSLVPIRRPTGRLGKEFLERKHAGPLNVAGSWGTHMWAGLGTTSSGGYPVVCAVGEDGVVGFPAVREFGWNVEVYRFGGGVGVEQFGDAGSGDHDAGVAMPRGQYTQAPGFEVELGGVASARAWVSGTGTVGLSARTAV